MDKLDKNKVNPMLKIPGIFNTALANTTIWCIEVYQKTISPDHGKLKDNNPFHGCKFYPSCSVYSIEVLKKYGFFPGIFKVLWRILRCNPWNKGGIDNVK